MILSELTLLQARAALKSRQLSAVEYVQALFQQAEQNDHLNAWISRDPQQLVADAQSSDSNRPALKHDGALMGIPLALKDNINTCGLPTSAGTQALLGKTPATNAAVFQSLLNAGALLAGKTNMHELALGITNNNAVTGAARNPWNAALIPGGSSGGSAVAVAARMVPAALGTDTGASVRLPAALCGIVGFRPTVGRYPCRGIVPLSKTRDTPGTMARSPRIEPQRIEAGCGAAQFL
jgi:mandelamide amidase